MTKCKKCGHDEFWVNEGLAWHGYPDENGDMYCKNSTCEIESIECKECGEKYEEGDFNSINFD